AAETIRQNADAEAQAAQRKLDETTTELARILDRGSDDLAPSPRKFFEKTLYKLTGMTTFLDDNSAMITAALDKSTKETKERYQAARKKLVAIGLVKNAEDLPLQLQPLRTDADGKAMLTAYEKSQLEAINALVLSDLLRETLAFTPRANYVDWRLSA